METLWQDLRYGVRQLLRSPGFTAVAVLTLALGIGANTAIFSVVNAAFFRPPAAEHPESLTWVSVTSLHGSRQGLLSYPDFLDFRDHNAVFSGFVGYERISVALSGGHASPERANAQLATGDLFSVLGLQPAAGRTFTASEVHAAQPVAVLSHSLWRRRFGSDPTLLGRSVLVNGQAFTVVGIAPPAFAGLELDNPADIWIPFGTRELLLPQSQTRTQRDAYILRALGRLKPGGSRADAAADLEVIARRLEQEYPEFSTGMRVELSALRGGVHPTGQGEPLELTGLLLIVTGLVLLIACANVANLLLVRAAGRGREVAIRLALGATRWRLLRQLTTESLLLSLAGGAAGLLAAFWFADFAGAFAEMPDSVARALTPNATVFGFALLLSALTGVFFGLVPATATSANVAPALKGEAALLGARRGRSRLQSLFAVAQVSLSLVLLVGAGLFLRSLGKAALVDPGFEVRNGVGISFDLEVQGYSPPQREVFYRQLLERVQAQPGVQSASLAALVPLSGQMIRTAVTREGQDESDERSAPAAFFNPVWPDYFRTMGIPLLRGRDFTLQDSEGAPGVVIVNETMARRFWPEADALGQRLSLDGARGPYLEVVGVARDSKYDELTEAPAPFFYLPRLQHSALFPRATLLVRATEDPARMLLTLEREIHTLDANLPLEKTWTFEQYLSQRMDRQRGLTTVLAVFGVVALILAAMGLYGVMAFAVAQRTREIGIRMALGAEVGDIRKLFVGEGVRLALIGVAVGIGLAAALTRALSSLLFGVTATDLPTFAGVGLLLVGVAALATYVPARRAARVDPMVALRYE